MSRELNPELFPGVKQAEVPIPVDSRGDTSGLPAKQEEWRMMVSQFELMKRKIKETEARVEMTNSRLTEFMGAAKVRFERLAGMNQRLEELVKANLHDLTNKQSQMMSRVNERKVGDAKIQELVDRHNQLVQSFEQRMNQLQKVVAEQEMQLITSRAEIKDATQEIMRLKRI